MPRAFSVPSPAGHHVQDLHADREGHGGVDVALGDVRAEAVRDQDHADHQQEAQGQHDQAGIVVDEVGQGIGGDQHNAHRDYDGGDHDGGIDGVINEDKLGLDVVCIQAKRWQGTVSRPTIQSFVGSMDMIRAKKGVVITTSDFSRDAVDFVERIEGKRVVLINGKHLAQLMIDHDVGVSTTGTYKLKEVSNDFFEEESA